MVDRGALRAAFWRCLTEEDQHVRELDDLQFVGPNRDRLAAKSANEELLLRLDVARDEMMMAVNNRAVFGRDQLCRRWQRGDERKRDADDKLQTQPSSQALSWLRSSVLVRTIDTQPLGNTTVATTSRSAMISYASGVWLKGYVLPTSAFKLICPVSARRM